jgi:hypothetical protein
MKKFFVVGVDGEATTLQRDAFTAHLQQLPSVGLWHHLAYTWLILDAEGALTAATLRAKAVQLMPGSGDIRSNVIVVEGKPRDWAAFVPEAAHKWLKDHVSASNWP